MEMPPLAPVNVRLVLESPQAVDDFLDLAERLLPADEAVVRLEDEVGNGRSTFLAPESGSAEVIAVEPCRVRADGIVESISWLRVPLAQMGATRWEVDALGARPVARELFAPTRIGTVREDFAAVAP